MKVGLSREDNLCTVQCQMVHQYIGSTSTVHYQYIISTLAVD